MKKLILLTIFISASTTASASYSAWVQTYAGAPWTKYGTYADYGKCEAAIKYLWHPAKKCLSD